MRKGSGERCQNGLSSWMVLAVYNLFQQLNPYASIWHIVRQHGMIISVNPTLVYIGLQMSQSKQDPESTPLTARASMSLSSFSSVCPATSNCKSLRMNCAQVCWLSIENLTIHFVNLPSSFDVESLCKFFSSHPILSTTLTSKPGT